MDGAEVSAAEVTDMLGLADRALVFDLMDALVAGDVPGALAITDRAHAFGADLGMMLGDLLDLVHMLTRLRAAPASSMALPEMERVRGGALADALTIPVLGRLWQMLLKGVAEVDAAPDRRAAAEMVLIRLCHIADLPTPGELVRKLTQGGAATARTEPQPPPQPPAGTVRAVANGAPVMMAAPSPAPPPPAAPPPSEPVLASFRDVVALVAERREPTLHGFLRHAVHLVRFAPGVIELRPEPDAPRDLAPRLAALLLEATGQRWTIALSKAEGEPTIDAQGQAADQTRRHRAAGHPLVRAIMAAFPGAVIGAVTDHTADAYGLTRTEAAEIALGEPDGFEIPLPDMDPSDTMEDDR